MGLLEAWMDVVHAARAAVEGLFALVTAVRALGDRALSLVGIPPAAAPYVVAIFLVVTAVALDARRGRWSR